VDISQLMLNQAVRVRDLPNDGTWKPVSEPETMLVHVVALRAEEAPAADAAAGAAEPEVVKKGKTDKEGEDAKDSKKK
jgi:large subunit ribosomal protein L25